MAFQPYGTVWIGRVPFDNSYKHVLVNYTNLAEQKEYFKSVCNRKFDRSSYTYIRSKQSIKVPVNAEELYTYNYLMYQNANYGTKWFYCFITDVVYINANTTELVLELDVWQTWYFDWKITQCFVEREHVNDDSIGNHTNPEPEIPMVQVVKSRTKQDFSNNMAIVCQRAQTDTSVAGSWLRPDSGPVLKSVDGGIYQGVFNGCEFIAADYLVEKVSHPIARFLNRMQEAGGGDAISAIYMVPKQFIHGGGFTNTGDALNETDVDDTGSFSVSCPRPTSLGSGYVPNNNKLFCYPYTFCRISDNNGAVSELAYEIWDRKAVTVFGSMEQSGEVFVVPLDYANIPYDWNSGISFTASVQCSWVYSTYKNWAAQNQMANALKFGVNAAMFIVPTLKGASAAAKAVSTGVREANILHNAGFSRFGNMAAAQGVRNAPGAAREGIGAIGAASMAAGASGIANQVADYDRMMRQPNSARGGATGNGLYSCGGLYFSIDQIVPRYEYCQIIDDFFTMYGYQVDLVKKPNMQGRKSWNYVKTANANNHGNVPAPDMALINSILDSGVTIWHTSDIGNYDLDNSIV